MNKASAKPSFLSLAIRICTNAFNFLPVRMSSGIASMLGRLGYYLLPKKRAVVYANLKTAFSSDKSPHQLQILTKTVFINMVKSFIELLSLSKIKETGLKTFVQHQDREHVDQAMQQGKGVILLAVHSGNWELGSVANAMLGHPYHLVAHKQPKMPEVNIWLDEWRGLAGAHSIAPGAATKEIIKALRRNEVVTLVLDQGGQNGVPVQFFGKTASMSTGAIRLALKYDCAVCLVWIIRNPDGHHVIKYFPAMTLTSTGDVEKDVITNVQRAAGNFEQLLQEHPMEYLWSYKVFKYTTDTQIVILDDGSALHLQQSRDKSLLMTTDLQEEGKHVKEETVVLNYRSPVHAFLSQFRIFLPSEDSLKYFLTNTSYKALMHVKADFVISCGSYSEGVNFILSKDHQAKSMVLTPS